MKKVTKIDGEMNFVMLRSVKKKDWKFILELRNQEDVRIACHDTSTISLDDHIKYMKRVNDDPNSYQWIIMYNDIDVGHVKLINGEFGYMINKQYRGKGIGKKTYDLVFDFAREIGLKQIKVVIKINEEIPLKVAKDKGFEIINTVKINKKNYAYELKKKL